MSHLGAWKFEEKRQKKQKTNSKKKAKRQRKQRKNKIFISYKPDFGNVNELIFTQ